MASLPCSSARGQAARSLRAIQGFIFCAKCGCYSSRKAQGFFEAAANSSQSATALAELSRLYQALGDTSKAQKAFERRLQQLDGELPALPMPEKSL